MKFHVLGPLRVFEDDVLVQLSGIKRRAALGYLLLHANSVVATSELVTALWGENPPPTARKILQNAISGLRRTLPAHSGDPDSELLVTHAPGYLLRVDPECVDLLQFRALAKRGQAALGAGRWDEAERDLRGALELWRGPALSDLLEDGYDWPELTALQNERFAVLESRMEAALAAGKDQQVISELEPVVGADPLRERLARQLMLALYRSGRQVDALAVYRRTRSALVDGLGLDPSPDLRKLERAILDHDPGLALGGAEARPATPPVVAATPPPTPDAVPPATVAPSAIVVPPAPEMPVAPPATAAPPAAVAIPAPEVPVAPVVPGRLPAPEPVLERPPPPDAGAAGERKHVTAVLVRVEVTDPTAAPEVVERALDAAGSVVREHVRQAGGRNQGSLGSLLLALFGTAQTREDDVHRAIRMALELAGLAQEGVRLRVAVAGGDALVSRSAQGLDDGAPDRLGVSGHLLDTAVELIAEAKPGLVRVCRNTRLACADDFDFSSAGPASCGYDVALRTRFELANRTELPLVQRDRELRQLDARVEDVQRRRRPHLVTVLGPPGIGKSRLMHEFRRQISERPGIRCLVGCNRGFGRETPYDALAGVVRSYAGITDDDPLAVRDRKLEAAVAGLVGSEPIAAQLEENLRDLVARKRERRDAGKTRPADSRAAFAAWRRFVEELAARETVVIILEDLDRIDDELLEFVGDLAENVGDLPLLVVGTARPELAHRTPYWAGGARNATTMSLEPLSRAATATLLGSLLPEPADERDARRRTALADQSGGNPLFAIEFARAVEAVGEGPPFENPAGPGGAAPLPVHNIVAARIDTLPDREKRVLYDAALMTGSFSEKVLAALGGQDSTDIQDCLRTLERHGFLRRCRLGPELGTIEYTFVHELVRKVACSRLPHGVRAQRYREAADWLSAQPDAPGDQLVHHFHQAVVHAEQAGLPTRELSARACDRLVTAAQAAMRRGAVAAADDCYRAALTFCTPDHPRRELLLRWQESVSGASPE